MDSQATEDFANYNRKKNNPQKSHKESIIRWILRAYKETVSKTNKNGKNIPSTLRDVFGFRKAGVFDTEEQQLILKEKPKYLSIGNGRGEFVHIERDFIPNDTLFYLIFSCMRD